MHILLVDDDKIIRDAVSHSLRAEGFSVITAEDGIEALEIIRTKHVNLIISDIVMPNLSGLGLLSMLKKFNFYRIPVILISSMDNGDILLTAVGLGASDFIIKPVCLDDVKTRVKKVLVSSFSS
jgi:DNA-binding response OmpR family regulator